MKIKPAEQNLKSVLSGHSILDMGSLEIHDLNQADAFLRVYGYDTQKKMDQEELWDIHKKSIAFLKEHILEESEVIPSELSVQDELMDIRKLLVIASQNLNAKNRRWACGILKVMHGFAHIKNDLFTQFSDQIQSQVLFNFNKFVIEDPVSGTKLKDESDGISLYKFEVKPFKTTASSVIKILCKRQAVAFSLLDRLGVRFVTKNTLDAFRVMDKLFRQNIVSLANVMPDQSSNSLYPVNLFFEVLNENKNETDETKIDEHLYEKLKSEEKRAQYHIKENEFSSNQYRFMKFICRHLVEIEIGGKKIHFFFPYEIQIMDYNTYIGNLTGPQAHDQYKLRQKTAMRLRVLGNS